MASANDKVRAFADELPQLVQQLGLGGVMAGMVGMVMPLVEGEVERIVAMPTDELDDLLAQIIALVASLTSDEVEA